MTIQIVHFLSRGESYNKNDTDVYLSVEKLDFLYIYFFQNFFQNNTDILCTQYKIGDSKHVVNSKKV
jgi:hypothetical protein